MAVSLPLIIAGTSLVAGGAQAYGSYEQGQAQAEAGRYNAEAQELNAREAARAGAARAFALRQRHGQALAAQAAGAAEAGQPLSGGGSALDLFEQSARFAELDVATATRDAALAERGLLADAGLRRWEAGEAGRAARLGLVTGLLGAGANAGTSYVGARNVQIAGGTGTTTATG